MSRSYKKAFVAISRRMADNVHSAARHLVRQRLAAMDYVEPTDEDLSLIDADVCELGLEDLGTKFGLEFEDSPEWDDLCKEMRRK